jgi:hypothetical protein
MEHYNKFFLAALIIGVIWILLVFAALRSLLKRRDMIMPAKLFWGLVIFCAPVVGLFFYFFMTSKRRNSIYAKNNPPKRV